MNDRRLRVSKRIRMEECIISTGFPFRKGDNFNQYLRMMGDVMQRTAGLRRPGAAALDLAYVAAGFTDGFFETGLSPWDVAAGSLLVTEAGGLIGNFTGESDFLEQKECLAGAPRIYGQLVSILGKYSKFASAGDKANVRTAVDALNRERTGDTHNPDAEAADNAAESAAGNATGGEGNEAASNERKDAPF
jgi:myo-inositol-1(or 4)-monophosphatase